MKSIHSLCLLIALAFIVSGCATAAKFQKNMDSWINQPESQLLSQYGPPHRVYESGGVKYLTYGNSRTAVIPGTNPTYQSTVVGNTVYTNSYGGTPAVPVNLSCDITFEVVNGYINRVTWRGNNCVAK